MVVYDFICEGQHKFEGWFQSIRDSQQQQDNGLLRCPICDSSNIRKIPSASYVNMGAPSPKQTLPSSPKVDVAQTVVTADVLDKMREWLDNNSHNVGEQFVEKSKSMHYGEIEKQNIHGVATVNDIMELHEEGINVLPLPGIPVSKQNLN